MKKWMLSFLLVWLAWFASARSVDSDALLFERATTLYQQGKYAQAIPVFEKLNRPEGNPNAALFCNLGNAHYRAANYGKAVWYYEKARFADPLDPDILHNLRLVSGKPNIKQSASLLGFTFDEFLLIKGVKQGFSAGSLLLFFGGLAFLVASLKIRKSLAGRLKKLAKTFALTGFILLASSAGGYNYLKPDASACIVLKPTSGHGGPSVLAHKTGSLAAGEKVTVRNEYRNWVKVKSESGKETWVKKMVLGKTGN